MAYILDIVFILIFVVFAVVGFKKGLIKMAISIAGVAIAICLAWFLSGPLANGLYEAVFRENIENNVREQITANTPDGLVGDVGDLVEKLPGFVGNLLENCGFGSPEEIRATLDKSVNETANAVSDTVCGVAQKSVTAVIRMVLFLLLAVVCYIAVRIVGWLLSKVCEMPILRSFNRAGGLLVGALEGFILLMVLSFIIKMIGNSSPADSIFSLQTLEQTHVVRFLISINPLL